MKNNKGMARYGVHRTQYEKNKKRVLNEQEVCAICGKPVDKKIKFPHPLSPTVDHIIPLNKGGHPSDLSNLQLAHLWCNRQKSDTIPSIGKRRETDGEIGNRVLPHAIDWLNYRGH